MNASPVRQVIASRTSLTPIEQNTAHRTSLTRPKIPVTTAAAAVVTVALSHPKRREK